MDIFNIIIQPFSWVFLFLYNLCKSYGLALILFSLVVKLVLLPFSYKSKKNMLKMGRLNPKLKQLEKQYKNDRNKYAEETQKLYKTYGVNPMGGCLWSLLPLPIMLGLYGVIRQPLTNLMKLTATQIESVATVLTGIGMTVGTDAYREMGMAQGIFENLSAVQSVVPNITPPGIDYNFFGLNLSLNPSWDFVTSGNWTWAAVGLFLLPIISGAVSFFSMRIASRTSAKKKTDEEVTAADKTTQKMNFIMPLISIYIGFIMPAGMCIYWIANSAFSIVQDLLLGRYIGKKLDVEDEKREEEEAIRAAEEKKRRSEAAALKYASGTKKKKQKQESTHEKGKVGDRPYARGRAFSAERFGDEPEDGTAQDALPPKEIEPATQDE